MERRVGAAEKTGGTAPHPTVPGGAECRGAEDFAARGSRANFRHAKQAPQDPPLPGAHVIALGKEPLRETGGRCDSVEDCRDAVGVARIRGPR